MGDMSHGGVSMGVVSHKCESYESEWSGCGNEVEGHLMCLFSLGGRCGVVVAAG